MPPSPSPPRIGIVGGGQLARMLVASATDLDLDVRVLARVTDTSLAGHDAIVTLGDPDDDGVLEAFAATVDVLTFENELVDLATLRHLERDGHLVRPGAHVLAMSDKATQRTTLAELGFPVPPFVIATEAAEIEKFAADHGWPLVVKSALGGYDGRGVHMVADPDELVAVPLGERHVVEPHLDIDVEVAVLVARRPGGDPVAYPVVETVQRRGMCREVHVPTTLSPEVEAAALDAARGIAVALDAVGVLAVELFVVDGDVLVNELAPRVHNSGHLTIEACATSQFEQHLRAVADLPLGSTELRVPAASMVNVVGHQHPVDPRTRLGALAPEGDVSIHLYGKAPRPERKIGHVTACAPDRARARAAALAAAATLMDLPEDQLT